MDPKSFSPLWLLVFIAGAGTISVADELITFMISNDEMTWNDAQDYCRRKGANLAYTLDEVERSDLDTLITTTLEDFSFSNESAWIDLKIDHCANEWRWTTTNEEINNDTATWSLTAESCRGICAGWSVDEPFFIPKTCDTMSPFVCQRNNTIPVTECPCDIYSNSTINLAASGNLVEIESHINQNESLCENLCIQNDACVAAELNETDATCVIYNSSDSKPWISKQTNESHTVIVKRCFTVKPFPPDPTTTTTPGSSTTTTTEAPTTTGESITAAAPRACTCGSATIAELYGPNVTLADVLKALTENLTIDRTNLSAYINTKISQDDTRPSATTIGYGLGVAILTLVFGGLFLMDAPSLVHDLKQLGSRVQGMVRKN